MKFSCTGELILLVFVLAVLAACAVPTAPPPSPPPPALSPSAANQQTPTTVVLAPSATSPEPASPTSTAGQETAAPTAPPPTASPIPTATALPATPLPTPSGPPQTIILIVVDSLRADHLSAYGYARPTTPNLDSLIAAQGARFTNAISPAPWTCPANAALMSGLDPVALDATWTTRVPLPNRVTTLAEALHQAGYTTAGFVNNTCVRAKNGFDQGFDLYDDHLLSIEGIDFSHKAPAETMNALAVKWLDNTYLPQYSGKPLFLFLYYMEPHVWYDPPPPYDTLYDPTYTGPFTPEGFGIGKDVVAGTSIPTPRDIEHLLALYDGEISYWDAHLGQLLSLLHLRGLLQNALVIVTADHGELFGEHGKWLHGSTLYEEVVRVPLLVWYPGAVPAGLVVETPVQSMDLMPTILDWAGVPIPQGLAAQSLRPLVEGVAPPAERPVFSALDGVTDPKHWAYWLAPRLDERAVQAGTWKLIHHPEDPALDELYLLQASSPYETENLLQAEPAQALRLRELVDRYFME